MATSKELDRIVSRSKPAGNSAFQIGVHDLREVSTPRGRKRREFESRERVERTRELGGDGAMTADEFKLALKFIKDTFGVSLNSTWTACTIRPRITARELFALVAGIEQGVTYRDRVLAVNRLRQLGFRVSFV